MTETDALATQEPIEARNDSMARITWRQFRRHPAAIFAVVTLGVIALSAILAPAIAPYDPDAINLVNRWQPPSLEHIFGTDKQGRDVFSRILFGGRISLSVGVMAMFAALILGTIAGVVAGFYGGRRDTVLMRATDFFLVFPQIFVLLFLSFILHQANITFLSGGLGNIVVVIGLTSWMIVARLVRAGFLKLREEEFVAAARSYGTGDRRLILSHLLPNAMGIIIVAATRGVADAILVESGLSFLGYGIQQPTASWGNMLQDTLATIGVYPWMTFYPGFMIFITVLALNYLGDAMRDALDPYKFIGSRRG